MTQPTTPTPAAGAATNASEKLDRRILAIGGVVVLGAIMAMLDITVINVALDQLIIQFDTTLDKMQWVATSYTLALATVIPLSGWAADRFDTKRIYLTAVSFFMIGSAWRRGSVRSSAPSSAAGSSTTCRGARSST